MSIPIVILGAGGHGREIVDIIEACNQAGTTDFEVLGFIVDAAYSQSITSINGKSILGDFSWLAGQANKVKAIGAVGSPALRKRLIEQASYYRVEFATLVHPSAILIAPLSVAEGVVIAAGCVLSSQVRLGKHVHINIGSTISHDVILEDFVTISPGVHIAGNVHIGAGSFVGIGVNIIEKKRVGQWSTVGAGSVIVRDVPANTTVVGNPGRVIKTRSDNWQFLEDEG